MHRKTDKHNPAPSINDDFDKKLRDQLFPVDDFDNDIFNQAENQIPQMPDSRNEPLPPEIFYETYETDQIANDELLEPEIMEHVESNSSIHSHTSHPTQVTADQTLEIKPVWQVKDCKTNLPIAFSDYNKIRLRGPNLVLNGNRLYFIIEDDDRVNENGYPDSNGIKASTYRFKNQKEAPWYSKPSINYQSTIAHVWQAYYPDGKELTDDDHYNITPMRNSYKLNDRRVCFKLSPKDRVDSNGNETLQGGMKAYLYRRKRSQTAPWNQVRADNTLHNVVDSDNPAPSSGVTRKNKRQKSRSSKTKENDQANKRSRRDSHHANPAILFASPASQESAELHEQIREVLYTGTSIELEHYLPQLHWYVVGDFEGQKADNQVMEAIMDIINSGKEMALSILYSPEYTHKGELLLSWYWHKILGDNLIPTRDTFNPAWQADQIKLVKEQLCSILSEVIITDQSIQFSDIKSFMQFANLYQSLNPGDIGLSAELTINPEDHSFQISFANKSAFDDFYSKVINIEIDSSSLGINL